MLLNTQEQGFKASQHPPPLNQPSPMSYQINNTQFNVLSLLSLSLINLPNNLSPTLHTHPCSCICSLFLLRTSHNQMLQYNSNYVYLIKFNLIKHFFKSYLCLSLSSYTLNGVCKKVTKHGLIVVFLK